MARHSSPSADRTPFDASRKEVKAIADLLKQEPRALSVYHAVGAQMRRLADDETLTGYGSGWRKKVADAVGQSESTLTKCLRFSEGYSADEVAELEELGVGWVQLYVAFSIGKKKRLQLLKRARKDGWGQKELRREIRRLRGTTRGGGRRRKEERSRGCLADAAELARLSGLWSAFFEQAWDGNEEKYLAEVGKLGGEAAAELGRLLDDAEEKLRALNERSAAALKTVKALRKKLPCEE